MQLLVTALDPAPVHLLPVKNSIVLLYISAGLIYEECSPVPKEQVKTLLC